MPNIYQQLELRFVLFSKEQNGNKKSSIVVTG